jgi:hypothetical protein
MTYSFGAVKAGIGHMVGKQRMLWISSGAQKRSIAA